MPSGTQILAVFREMFFKSAAVYFHRKKQFYESLFTVINIQFS